MLHCGFFHCASPKNKTWLPCMEAQHLGGGGRREVEFKASLGDIRFWLRKTKGGGKESINELLCVWVSSLLPVSVLYKQTQDYLARMHASLSNKLFSLANQYIKWYTKRKKLVLFCLIIQKLICFRSDQLEIQWAVVYVWFVQSSCEFGFETLKLRSCVDSKCTVQVQSYLFGSLGSVTFQYAEIFSFQSNGREAYHLCYPGSCVVDWLVLIINLALYCRCVVEQSQIGSVRTEVTYL